MDDAFLHRRNGRLKMKNPWMKKIEAKKKPEYLNMYWKKSNGTAGDLFCITPRIASIGFIFCVIIPEGNLFKYEPFVLTATERLDIPRILQALEKQMLKSFNFHFITEKSHFGIESVKAIKGKEKS